MKPVPLPEPPFAPHTRGSIRQPRQRGKPMTPTERALLGYWLCEECGEWVEGDEVERLHHMFGHVTGHADGYHLRRACERAGRQWLDWYLRAGL